MFIPLHDANSLSHIKLQYVTLAIIAVNILIWLVMGTPAILSEEAVKAAIYSYGFIPAVANGYETLPVNLDILPPAATYLSYAFLHGDFMHLAGNMLFVWVFGDNIEDAMGHMRYLFFYLACAAVGALAHSMMAPDSEAPLIGASGAVAGIIGAYIILHPKVRIWVLALGKIPLRISAMYVLGFWIALQIYQFFANPDNAISWAAHIGGLVAGMVLIVFLKRSEVTLFDRNINGSLPIPASGKPPHQTSDGQKSSDIQSQNSPAQTSVPQTGPWTDSRADPQPDKKSGPIKWGR